MHGAAIFVTSQTRSVSLLRIIVIYGTGEGAPLGFVPAANCSISHQPEPPLKGEVGRRKAARKGV